MNTDRDFERIATAWLADGPDQLSNRVLDAVVEEIHVTRQRRVMRVPRRIPAMTIPARLGAAAAIGVLLFGGALILVRPSSPLVAAPPMTAQASAAPVGSPTPSTIAESTPAVTSNPETVDSVARAFQDALNNGQLESAADLMATNVLINNVVIATRDDVIAALGQICAGDISAVWSLRGNTVRYDIRLRDRPDDIHLRDKPGSRCSEAGHGVVAEFTVVGSKITSYRPMAQRFD